MKLLLCILCKDVKRLGRERTECGCGKAWANLINFDDKDNHVAANHLAIIIGIDEKQLSEALTRKIDDPTGSQRVPAFFLPEPCKSVHRVTEGRAEAPAKRASGQRRPSKEARV